MAAAASDGQADGDDNDLIENDMIDDEDDLDDDELQQMLQDNEADAGAMTDTANTDWYGPCALTSEVCIARHAHMTTMSEMCQRSPRQDCNLWRTSMGMQLHTKSALHDFIYHVLHLAQIMCLPSSKLPAPLITYLCKHMIL